MANIDIISYIENRLTAHAKDNASLQADIVSNTDFSVMSGGYTHTVTYRQAPSGPPTRRYKSQLKRQPAKPPADTFR
jgi:hypothetical protein